MNHLLSGNAACWIHNMYWHVIEQWQWSVNMVYAWVTTGYVWSVYHQWSESSHLATCICTSSLSHL